MSVDIAGDGTVSALTPAGKQVLGQLEIYRFPNNAGLSGEGGNLYRQTEASGSPVAGKAGELGCGSLLSKYLEKSNVEMVTELVSLINAQRAYEINSRTIRTGDNILQQLSQLIR
jgi:flagellar basal-body rod protein FlgG